MKWIWFICLLAAATGLRAQPSGLPDIGGLSSNLDFSALEREAETSALASTNVLPSLEVIQRLPSTAVADPTPHTNALAVFLFAQTERHLLVLPDIRDPDNSIRILLAVVDERGIPSDGPMELRLHADGKASLALPVATLPGGTLPTGMTYSPAGREDWFATRIDRPEQGRSDASMLEGIRRLRKHARSQGADIHTQDVMLLPLRGHPRQMLLCVRVAEE